jgi:hypothetical protein
VKLSSKDANALGIVTPPQKRTAKVKRGKFNRELFVAMCVGHGLPTPIFEHEFHDTREWKFDVCWPHLAIPIALEIDGGAWTQGRHTRGKGFIEDQHKRNEAVLMGYRVFHCTPDDVKSGAVFALLKRAFSGRS